MEEAELVFLGRIDWGGGGVGFVIDGFGNSLAILPLTLSATNRGRFVFSDCDCDCDCVVGIAGVGVTRNWRPGEGVLGT